MASNQKKKLSFNWHQFIFLPLAAVFLAGAIAFFIEALIFLGIVLLLTALLFMAGSLTNPLLYVFSPTSITLVYLILPNERYLWKDVESVDASFIFEHGRDLQVLSLPVYRISGAPDSNLYFYMSGYVCTTHRNRRLIERYWGGKVNGYFSDLKAALEKRRSKRAKALAEARRHQLETEILPLERAARAELREIIEKLTDRATAGGLELRISYLYLTSSCKESRSRPNESYSYLVSVDISRPGETNEDRILTKSVFLLSVHCSRRSVSGKVHHNAKDLLYSAVSEALVEIAEKGIDAYIEEAERS